MFKPLGGITKYTNVKIDTVHTNPETMLKLFSKTNDTIQNSVCQVIKRQKEVK